MGITQAEFLGIAAAASGAVLLPATAAVRPR
jgi:hypothetical protein